MYHVACELVLVLILLGQYMFHTEKFQQTLVIHAFFDFFTFAKVN